MLIMSLRSESFDIICTLFSSPFSTGPTTTPPVNSVTKEVEICAECKPGITRTFAAPLSLLKAYSFLGFWDSAVVIDQIEFDLVF